MFKNIVRVILVIIGIYLILFTPVGLLTLLFLVIGGVPILLAFALIGLMIWVSTPNKRS